jgi:Tfp pilus assembly protein PilX
MNIYISRTPSFAHFTGARRQRGTMLVISLIVLVAMTLAGVAMMRSVDTSAIVAGNIAFKQSSLNAADSGIQAGFTYLTAFSGTPTLYNDNNAAGVSSVGYFSSAPISEPDWKDPSVWTNAASINAGVADAGGNVVQYLIHRLCPVANCAPNATCAAVVNVCGSTPDTTAVSGEGVDQSAANFFTRPPATHYRVTSRVVGPRQSTAVVQTLLRTQ